MFRLLKCVCIHINKMILSWNFLFCKKSYVSRIKRFGPKWEILDIDIGNTINIYSKISSLEGSYRVLTLVDIFLTA